MVPLHQLYDAISISPMNDHLITITQPVADLEMIEAEDTLFRYKSAVFLPDGIPDAAHQSDPEAEGGKLSEQTRVNGLAVLKGFFRYVSICQARGRPKRLLITGHTDTVGSDNYNKTLSLKRAQVVEALILGGMSGADDDEWSAPGASDSPRWSVSKVDEDAFLEARRTFAKHCEETATTEDEQQVLAWLSRLLANRHLKPVSTIPYWDEVDPGPIDGITGEKTRTGIRNFKTIFKREYPDFTHHEQTPRSPDLMKIISGINPKIVAFDFYCWAALFDILQAELFLAVKEDGFELEKVRSGLRWVNPEKRSVGCGETWPLEKRRDPKSEAFKSQSNRRVEILLYDPNEINLGKNKTMADKAKLPVECGFFPCKDEDCSQSDCHVYRVIERSDDEAFKPMLRWKYIDIDDEGGFTFPLRLRLLKNFRPLANQPFTIREEDSDYEMKGETDEDGVFEKPIRMPRDVEKAILVVGGKISFLLSFEEKLEPTKDYKGMQVRLFNLALYKGELEGNHDKLSKAALKRFQTKFGLDATGDFDTNGETEQCLEKEYGC